MRIILNFRGQLANALGGSSEKIDVDSQAWDMPGSIETRAVDQFIRRLRKLYEVDSSQPRHFLTIRDIGYRFLSEVEGNDSAHEKRTSDA